MNDDKRYVGIPIIAVSGTADSQIYSQCLEAGANEYFELDYSANMELSERLKNLNI